MRSEEAGSSEIGDPQVKPVGNPGGFLFPQGALRHWKVLGLRAASPQSESG